MRAQLVWAGLNNRPIRAQLDWAGLNNRPIRVQLDWAGLNNRPIRAFVKFVNLMSFFFSYAGSSTLYTCQRVGGQSFELA